MKIDSTAVILHGDVDARLYIERRIRYHKIYKREENNGCQRVFVYLSWVGARGDGSRDFGACLGFTENE